MIDKPTTESEQAQVDAVKQQIRRILGELKSLAKTEAGDEEFLGQLGKRTLETTGAAGFTIWQIDDDQDVVAIHDSGTTPNQSGLDRNQLEIHSRLVRTVSEGERPTLIEPDARDSASGNVINPMAYLLLLKPLQDPALQYRYVLELLQRPDIAAAARTGYMRYLEEIGEIYSAWQARFQLRHQSSRQGRQQQTLDFVRDIHSSLDPREVAYAAANDGRVLTGCDRMSLLKFDGRRAHVLAVSGQDDFDDRANVIRKLQNLATIVCQSGQALWTGGEDRGEMPRAIREPLDDFLNESHSRTLGITPLFGHSSNTMDELADEPAAEPTCAGAMVVEWFGHEAAMQAAENEVEMLAEHVGRALANARAHHGVFLLPLWKAVGNWKWLVQAKTLPRTLAVLGAVLALLLFFFIFPWPLNMRVEGTLQPVGQQNVFANIEGVVSRVHVVHGQAVRSGQKLLDLRNDELEYRLESTTGELKQIENEIGTTRAGSLAELTPDLAAAADSRLAALNQKRLTLLQQIGLLREMTEKLEVYSPIDGTIVSWDPVRELTERPVSREDVLLVVAALDSDWQMELFIPERKYGHVLSAGDQPDVTFFTATNPNKSYRASIVEIETHASEHPRHGSAVRAFAQFDPDNAPDLYVGAAVTAKIRCGTASIGYCWFHELFEFVQSRVLF